MDRNIAKGRSFEMSLLRGKMMSLEFTNEEWEAIERACGLQARRDEEIAAMSNRPMIRNERLDSATELKRIAAEITRARRERAMRRACRNCED
jgi:hypothetical protein